MTKIAWQWLTFDKLTKDQLYQLLALRSEVFVVEQHCPYQDLDFLDQQSEHLLGWHDQDLATYARLYGKKSNIISFGRIVTSPKYRRQGIGKALTTEVLAHAKKIYPNSIIEISAQLYLKKFYTGFGFIAQGKPYDEDGIPHIFMTHTV